MFKEQYFPQEFKITKQNQMFDFIEDGITYKIFISSKGTIAFFKPNTSIFHRNNDKPAVLNYEGEVEWFINDKHHRLNGPAIIAPSGAQSWYYQGQKIEVSSQEEYEQWLCLKAFM